MPENVRTATTGTERLAEPFSSARGWQLGEVLGSGGSATVFSAVTAEGPAALRGQDDKAEEVSQVNEEGADRHTALVWSNFAEHCRNAP